MAPANASVQAAPLSATAGDGTDGSNKPGQAEFSMAIVPEGNASAKQSKAKSPGAGTPPTAGEKSVFDDGKPGGEESAADKSEQNAQNKAQRKGENAQAGWQQITESLTKITERLDGLEKRPAAEDKEGEKGKKAAPDNEAMATLAETLNATNLRLERMEFERDNSDVTSKDNIEAWKKVNTDPKFEKFSLAERREHVMGKAATSRAGAMQDQLSRAEGSMPAGSGGSGSSPKAGNPLVDEDTIAVGRAFGISREELEKELS